MVPGSQANIFAALCNPARVNMSRQPLPTSETKSPLTDEVGETVVIETVAEEPAFFDMGTSTHTKSTTYAPVPPAGPTRYNATPTMSVEQDDLLQTRQGEEKQALLLELRRLEMDGTKLTKTFTMTDSAMSMEFEIERHRVASDTSTSVQFMSDGMRLALNGVELMNERFGPILQLNGWSAELTRDMSRFRGPLGRIYKRLFRKGSPSPFLELGFLIIGSMAMTHFRNKGGGGAMAAAMMGGLMNPSTTETPSTGTAARPTRPGPPRSPTVSSQSHVPFDIPPGPLPVDRNVRRRAPMAPPRGRGPMIQPVVTDDDDDDAAISLGKGMVSRRKRPRTASVKSGGSSQSSRSTRSIRSTRSNRSTKGTPLNLT